MSIKNLVFCDGCGKQMSVVDNDGEIIINGYIVEGEIKISTSERTNCGSSHARVFSSWGTHFCSASCLHKPFKELTTLISAGEQS